MCCKSSLIEHGVICWFLILRVLMKHHTRVSERIEAVSLLHERWKDGLDVMLSDLLDK